MADRPSPQLRAAARQLTQARQRYVRSSRERQNNLAMFDRRIRAASVIIVISTVLLALVADVLSIVDLGWIVSWALALCTWYIGRRISAIRQVSGDILAATSTLQWEFARRAAQFGSIARATGRGELVAPLSQGRTKASTKSYLSTYLRDTIIAQLIELIPIIDILPFYLGGAIKIIVNQRSARREAQSLLREYALIATRLGALELFALEYQEASFNASRIPALRRVPPSTRAPRPVPSPATRAPAFVAP